MNFKLLNAKTDQGKEIIYNLMQDYLSELSLYEDETAIFKKDNNGLYEMSKYTKLYWKEDNRYPYILKCNNEIAGFALVRFNENNYHEIGEFFVIDKYRRLKAGKYMAFNIFNKYHGKWEIRTLLKNNRAQEFWRKIIKEYTNNNFEEKLIRNNTRHAFYFDNGEENNE